MTPERWQRVKDIFQAGLERAREERSDFLSNACGGDEALRKEVESLLASHAKDGSFIDSPAYEAAADLLVAENPELKAGQTIGHYEILSTLGKGGMGEVYLAQDRRLGRKVALKFLPASFMQHADRLRRFELEARAASALNHPNILTIHEIGEAETRHFIATEFINGETLRQRIATGPIKTSDALSIAEQIASALVAAHGEGIVHRDIKPENIMLRRDGIVKVLDFGLAKLTEPKQINAEDSTRKIVYTSAGMVMGTVSYMSPEQTRGLSVDARTDIWSLGVVLYETLSGRQPFGGPTPSDILVAILEHEPKSLTTSSPHLPEALEWIVSKALTKEREDRYQTARELLTDLRRLQQRLTVNAELDRSAPPQSISSSATEGGAGFRVRSPERGKRTWMWAPLLAILILASILVGWKRGSWFLRARETQPVVVLMDSPLPDRVYDPETRKNGGTNADDITDILRDLPIVIEKENTSPLWHREDQVLREAPSLIVIHRSCFADSTLGFDPQSPASQIADNKVESFLGYIGLGNPSTKFLVYTRRSGDPTAWMAGVVNRFPNLKGRVFAVTVQGGAEHATFRDPETKKLVRQQVVSILGLQQ